jgi:hypothetical protein
VRRRERLAASIQSYADAMVGAGLAVDAELAQAGVEHLLAGEAAPWVGEPLTAHQNQSTSLLTPAEVISAFP